MRDSLIMMVVGAVAGLILALGTAELLEPALRSSRVDPVTGLRIE